MPSSRNIETQIPLVPGLVDVSLPETAVLLDFTTDGATGLNAVIIYIVDESVAPPRIVPRHFEILGPGDVLNQTERQYRYVGRAFRVSNFLLWERVLD